MSFIRSFQSEWLKRRRSLASWLIVVGALFMPAMTLLRLLNDREKLPELYAQENFWSVIWGQNWQSMNLMLLPIGIILAVGLVTQIEYKNNGWKQLHTTPQGLTTIFFAKFAVIFVMALQVFLLFNLGMYIVGVIPSLLFASVPYPAGEIPFGLFFEKNVHYFVNILPILSLQYLLSLQFKNFLVPLGAGFAIWLAGAISLSWKYSYLFPYLHGGIDFIVGGGQLDLVLPMNIQLLSLIYFAAFMVAGYALYMFKKERG
ncbi:MAG TPA: ABC transporter permease [Pyrinomonadaceae bacterium]|mgnify:CR=1 FL=1|nr:ABC transporter permease [Pyrinomonadaceae bacterium]